MKEEDRRTSLSVSVKTIKRFKKCKILSYGDSIDSGLNKLLQFYEDKTYWNENEKK